MTSSPALVGLQDMGPDMVAMGNIRPLTDHICAEIFGIGLRHPDDGTVAALARGLARTQGPVLSTPGNVG